MHIKKEETFTIRTPSQNTNWKTPRLKQYKV